MTATTKDIAEFLALAAGNELLPSAAAVEWADSIIQSEDRPPDWTFDLSLAKNKCLADVCRLLHNVPGTTSGDLPLKLLFAFVNWQWKEGHIDRSRLAATLYQCIWWPDFSRYPCFSDEILAGRGRMLLDISDGYSLVDDGFEKLEDVDLRAKEFLAEYQSYFQMIPKFFFKKAHKSNI